MTAPLHRASLGEILTHIYYDQRRRLEGYGIEWMMDSAGMKARVPAEAQGAEIAAAPREETQG